MLFFKVLIVKWQRDKRLNMYVLKLTVNNDYLWVNKIID